MSNSHKTITILARSLDKHLSAMGMGHRELVDLACALIDHAAERATQEQEPTTAPLP
jgi:hypothetical protein